jgi:hypothetical protein
MVTVKTDADGTFRYIYEKELADGEHEVYVALTNTDGAILAKSNGFRFIKEAEAFVTKPKFSLFFTPDYHKAAVNYEKAANKFIAARFLKEAIVVTVRAAELQSKDGTQNSSVNNYSKAADLALKIGDRPAAAGYLRKVADSYLEVPN